MSRLSNIVAELKQYSTLGIEDRISSYREYTQALTGYAPALLTAAEALEVAQVALRKAATSMPDDDCQWIDEALTTIDAALG